MAKRALITGITGQDGSYLTELLIRKGYEVHGLVRRTSAVQRNRLDALDLTPAQREKQLFLHYGDLSESSGLSRLAHRTQPDEVYHLGSQSHVQVSFESPKYTFEINASGTVRLLECFRDCNKPIRFYHASTCEMYGRPEESPQNEKTPFRPVSPYACSKTASHFLTACYRESYGLFACNGILFNHESPRRGENFVTRKIARGVAAIKRGLQKKLTLGSLETRKDWGYAPEYVEAMWRMLQHDKPDDYVIATGEAHRVGEFVEMAFQIVGLDWREFVETDPAEVRPAEVGALVGDASKAERVLGWRAQTRFQGLVKLMVEAELQALSR
ncbi:MAG: GDP-mannose 4,6-dehydratase [Verrucomicrobia bacterium]|nr:GDP-mannose 4,6-dehydratase [Verrucomicrobiota bacterium]